MKALWRVGRIQLQPGEVFVDCPLKALNESRSRHGISSHLLLRSVQAVTRLLSTTPLNHVQLEVRTSLEIASWIPSLVGKFLPLDSCLAPLATSGWHAHRVHDTVRFLAEIQFSHLVGSRVW